MTSGSEPSLNSIFSLLPVPLRWRVVYKFCIRDIPPFTSTPTSTRAEPPRAYSLSSFRSFLVWLRRRFGRADSVQAVAFVLKYSRLGRSPSRARTAVLKRRARARRSPPVLGEAVRQRGMEGHGVNGKVWERALGVSTGCRCAGWPLSCAQGLPRPSCPDLRARARSESGRDGARE